MESAPVLRFPSLDSTNAEARRHLAKGRAPGFAVFARAQTAGRGRQGRTWVSSVDAGIYLTLTQSVAEPVSEQGFVSIVAAVAAAEWLESYGLLVGIKWPNDLRVDGRKIAGILCERQSGHLVIGIGVNWSSSPNDIDQPTTSVVEEVGRPCAQAQAEGELLRALQTAMMLWQAGGQSDLARRWWRLAEKQRSYVYEGIQVRPQGLSDRGVLLVRDADGAERSISCGELEDAAP